MYLPYAITGSCPIAYTLFPPFLIQKVSTVGSQRRKRKEVYNKTEEKAPQSRRVGETRYTIEHLNRDVSALRRTTGLFCGVIARGWSKNRRF